MTNYIVVFITCASKEEADRIASALVAERYAACANMIDKVRSIFRWQDRVEDSDEVLLVLKSKAALFNQIEKTVKEIHSYDLPEIIALPIIKGSKDYLEWIEMETE